MVESLKTSKDRKIGVMIMLTTDEIRYLDRKVDKKIAQLASRSAVLRTLVAVAIEDPSVLKVK